MFKAPRSVATLRSVASVLVLAACAATAGPGAIDADVADAHDAVCREADDEIVAEGGGQSALVGLPLVVVWQDDERPMHLYANDTRYALCMVFPAESAATFDSGRWPAGPAGWVHPVFGAGSSDSRMMEVGIVDPRVASLEVRMGGEPVWAAVGEGFYLVEVENQGGEPSAITYMPFDSCGQPIRGVIQAGDTPCPPDP